MEEVLAGIDGVLPYLDDIFVKGIGIEDHNKRLEQVLQRLEKEGIHLKREKCAFMVPEIELLGFRVNKRGIQPTPDKVAAIHRAPTPKNITELQAFLGLLNFYGCFLKNRSNVLEPLHQLLQKDAQWCWTHIHDKSYKAAKELLQEDHTLAHFDENLPVILTCDASSYGVGAVLGHELPEGKEVPIAYYSRTLAKAERNYSQTDKEALAVISAVKKFHQYLFGRRFKIITDHKPLLGLLSPTKPLPQMVSPRVLRWSLSLSAYEYEIEYRKGKQIINADALSRLPVSSTDFEIPAPPGILLLEASTDIQIDAKLLASITQKDPILSRVSLWILNGWPDKAEDEKFKPYFSRKDELSVHQNCVLWGSRVVIPESLRNEVLILLHASHPGIVRMKGLARSYVWWPKMDHQIEVAVKSCHICQSFQKFPPKAPLHPWEWMERPWSRIHIDFAGPFYGQTFFIVVDSHSKWLEVLPVSSMSSATAIMNLRSLFATHGLCDTIASDNGSTFTSSEFGDFLSKNQIRQILVAPYHPSSNGQAERMVATTKDALKCIIHGSWKARLARFLFSQHTLPCTTTGRTPAELLMNRRLTSLLDRLHPDLNKTMKEKKEDNASKSHSERRSRAFSVNDPVYIRNYSSGAPWTPATILESTGPLSYRAKTVDGEISKRHVDQIRSRLVLEGNDPDLPPSIEAPELPDSHDPDSEVSYPNQLPTVAETGDSPSLPQEKLALPPVVQDVPHHSSRSVSRPKYLDDYVLQLMREGVSCPELLSHLYSPTDGL